MSNLGPVSRLLLHAGRELDKWTKWRAIAALTGWVCLPLTMVRGTQLASPSGARTATRSASGETCKRQILTPCSNKATFWPLISAELCYRRSGLDLEDFGDKVVSRFCKCGSAPGTLALAVELDAVGIRARA